MGLAGQEENQTLQETVGAEVTLCYSPQGSASIRSWESPFFLYSASQLLLRSPLLVRDSKVLLHCRFPLQTLQWTVMNLWRCLAPEGQSDRRDFTKSLMLWFVFSNKAASLISILADLWETAKQWYLHTEDECLFSTHISNVPWWLHKYFYPCLLLAFLSAKAFGCFVVCFNKPTTSFLWTSLCSQAFVSQNWRGRITQISLYTVVL